MQDTIPVLKKNALIAFNNADDKGKKMLTDLLGSNNISGNIMDMVKTFEDAEALDTGWTDQDEFYLQSVKKAVIITRVLNGDWKANYADKNQPKHYVWMRYDPSVSAFVFIFTHFGITYANSATGSRHVFKDGKTARYFAEQFTTLINHIIL